MGRTDTNGNNPGREYIRIALVYDSKTTELGLTKLANKLFN
jgi:hypothetical protein